jgi:hypothetical protein
MVRKHQIYIRIVETLKVLGPLWFVTQLQLQRNYLADAGLYISDNLISFYDNIEPLLPLPRIIESDVQRLTLIFKTYPKTI